MNDQVADFRADRTNLTALAGLDTAPVSLEPYRSQDWFDAEVRQVFKRAWLCLGREERIAAPGDYFVQTLEFARAEVLVTRTKDGRIRAFHNVCSHRSNKVVLEREGNASRFMCRYHNWTYRNDGELVGVPDQKNFFDFDRKSCGLTPSPATSGKGGSSSTSSASRKCRWPNSSARSGKSTGASPTPMPTARSCSSPG
ncbi:aromatic ring-hydroxylating dioxygenase subunit alpha [Novosphingobium resinovorum]